jgi:hypothetical protein
MPDLNTLIKAIITSDGKGFTARWSLAQWLHESDEKSDTLAQQVVAVWESTVATTGIRSEAPSSAAIRQYRAAWTLWGNAADGTVSPWQAYAWRSLAKGKNGKPLTGAALHKAWKSIPAKGRPEPKASADDNVTIKVPQALADRLKAAADEANVTIADIIAMLLDSQDEAQE